MPMTAKTSSSSCAIKSASKAERRDLQDQQVCIVGPVSRTEASSSRQETFTLITKLADLESGEGVEGYEQLDNHSLVG